jgi:hypothetical protein
VKILNQWSRDSSTNHMNEDQTFKLIICCTPTMLFIASNNCVVYSPFMCTKLLIA